MTTEAASGRFVADSLDEVLTHIEAIGAACTSLEMKPKDQESRGRDLIKVTLPLGDRQDATNMTAVDELLLRLDGSCTGVKGSLEPHPHHPAVLTYGNVVIGGDKRYKVLARRDRDPAHYPQLTTEVIDSVRPVTRLMGDLDDHLRGAGFDGGLPVYFAEIGFDNPDPTFPIKGLIRGISDSPGHLAAIENWLGRTYPLRGIEDIFSSTPSGGVYALHIGSIPTRLSLLRTYEYANGS